jgi:hypothetical protein
MGREEKGRVKTFSPWVARSRYKPCQEGLLSRNVCLVNRPVDPELTAEVKLEEQT